MTRKKYIVVAGVAALAAVGIGGAAFAGTDKGAHETDTPISGPARERASAVAVDAAGGGRVTETEQGDEESYYQVEVTKDDGSHVDVNLDRAFNVVKTKTEGAERGGD